ncbi:MAG: DUF2948 family protein [Alphaproteobacteria bacterium]|nr:DUF2948 family protein [Alphaproteobacteria bacterium]
MDGKPSAGSLLRLRAMDQGDLQVIAACLQDALVPLREMAFMAEERRFMAAFNRFRWERLADPNDVADLTLCQSVLRVEHVDAVQYRGLDGDLDGVKFELLTIVSEPDDEGGLMLTLLFAGDIALRLKVNSLLVTLEDFGESWAASVAPHHDLSDISSQGP